MPVIAEERLSRIAVKWSLSAEDQKLLGELLSWRAKTSRASYDQCLQRAEWSSDIYSFMKSMETAREEAGPQRPDISVRPDTYALIKDNAKERGISMSYALDSLIMGALSMLESAK